MPSSAPPTARAALPPPSRPGSIDPLVVNTVLIAVRQAANLLCDRWTLLILLSAHTGVTRFADFRERCGAANRLLSTRLAMLEEQEVMVRLAYMRRPLRHGYHLTHMGLALFKMFAAMLRWERDWHESEAGTGLAIDHSACGHVAVQPVLGCEACGAAISARDVDLTISQKVIREMPPKGTAYRRSTLNVASEDLAQKVPMPHCLDIFGDKWSIEVVMCAYVRVSSFSDFQTHTGMSTNILADRLARLTAAGIFQPAEGGEGQRRGLYRLTEKGIALFPILVEIESWADEWQRDRFRSPTLLFHRPCGQRLKLMVNCDGCGQALTRKDCAVRMG